MVHGDEVTDCGVFSCERCRNDDEVAYVAHQYCWNLARKADPVPSLYRFAALTRQLLPPGHSRKPPVTAIFPADLPANTSLARLLEAISRRFPAELQGKIHRYLRLHLIAAVLRTFRTVTTFPAGRRRKPCCKRFARPAEIKSLYVETRRIFGLDYISDIGFNKDCNASIKTDNRKVRGIRFALGSYGVRGIRILYDDGVSSWLGSTTFCWYGEVYGTDLGRLSIFRDVSISWAVSRGASPNIGS